MSRAMYAGSIDVHPLLMEGPKIQGVEKQRRNAASGTPACGGYGTCVRPLQYLRSAATVPAFGRYSACVRPLQYPRSAATVPAYKILAQTPLGPSGTGPKIQGVEKQRRNAASGTPACGGYGTCVRPLQYLRSAATVPAFGRYSACVRPLQYPRSAATAAVDRQSGPRSETIFLRQSALEYLTDFSTNGFSSSWRSKQVRSREKPGDGGGARRVREGERL
ncbi:hypothetical protein F511_19819 [Dorcoceras hygrometricum]|uniref:Uncharacterized protein n=1 Tax=Dorcoceras hygrometricum TaxID=472368 RepID=A0A2Z7BT69_9LAMI|nr:hypothetical protein F511_19819 [Dorcoceras hygrometricum]